MSVQEKFKEILEKNEFAILDYIFLSPKDDLSKFQKKVLTNATTILEENLVGDVKYFGGLVKKNEDSFEEYLNRIKKEIEKGENEDLKKGLNNLLKEYKKKLEEYIEKVCYAILPVKEMPWTDVLFRTAPRMTIHEDSVELYDSRIAYYGEIKSLISKTTIFGTLKGEEPLFAPVMGKLDLDFEFKESEEGAKKSYNFAYISAIIDSLDNSSTKSHLARYHEGYQRHGEPICDFLMEDDDLTGMMKNLTSGVESGRIDSEMAVSAIALPQPSDNTTLVLVLNDGNEEKDFEICFEAVLRFSAACYNAPSLEIPPSQGQSTHQSGGVTTPGGQELKQWTAEELVEEAQKRNASSLPEGVGVWTEEELKKMSEQRGSGLPEGMEVWTEEELEDLAKKRQGGLDIPEWEPDEGMKECSNCGYALREGWSECPVCGTPVGETTSSTEEQEQKPEPETAEHPPEESDDEFLTEEDQPSDDQ
jgi:hypothetical protein